MDDGEFENSFIILIIISILFDPFCPCMLLSEKHCHSLFIRLFTEPGKEEVHSQTMYELFSNHSLRLKIFTFKVQ